MEGERGSQWQLLPEKGFILVDKALLGPFKVSLLVPCETEDLGPQ